MSHGTGTRSGRSNWLERFATNATRWTGSSWAFGTAVSVVAVWLVSGPMFDYSDTWQLIINTGTTIVTFLMVFLIQQTQNKDALAVQLKLNEIVAALEGASNRLIDVEDLSTDELEVLRTHFRRLAQMAKQDSRLTASHSVEEAEVRHRIKEHSHRSRAGSARSTRAKAKDAG
jgi:low affinity Fe/Cu permease